jgi:hypothetical protein
MAVAYAQPSKAIASATDKPAAPTPRIAATTEAVALSTEPTTAPGAAPATMEAVVPASNPAAPWESVTPAMSDAITYDDLESDEGAVTPLVPNLDSLDEDAKKKIEAFKDRLADWKPGDDQGEPNTGQRVRNLLSVAAVGDLVQDELEGAYPYVIFENLKADIPDKELIKVLTWIINNPNEGKVFTKVDDLGIDGEATEESVRERVTAYAKKLLARLLGKVK